MTRAAFVGAPLGTSSLLIKGRSVHSVQSQRRCVPRVGAVRRQNTSMGLFGLGLPEIAVVAGVGIFLFGPKKIADMGKELGGIAGSVKKATSEFQSAMEESIKEADEELAQKKMDKEAAKNQTVDAAATKVEPAAATKVEPAATKVEPAEVQEAK